MAYIERMTRLTSPRFGGAFFFGARPRRPRSLRCELSAPLRGRFLANIRLAPLRRGVLFWCDVLPDCDSAVRGYMAAGASRPAGGIVVLAPDGRGAALYWRPGSAQGRANRDNIGQVSSGRTDRVVVLSSPTEHGPGQSPVPHT
jgi:hypothetical protein